MMASDELSLQIGSCLSNRRKKKNAVKNRDDLPALNEQITSVHQPYRMHKRAVIGLEMTMEESIVF